MPFIRKVHVLFKTRLIFSRINGPIIPVCIPGKDQLHVFITSRQAISSYVKTGRQTTSLDIANEKHTFKLQFFVGLSFVKLALNPSMKIDHYCTRFDCCKIVNHFLQVRACEV